MSLRSQAFRAMFWVALTGNLGKIIAFLTQLLLARLLAPEAFGLIAVTTVVLNSIQVFQDAGLSQTLIARPENSSEVLNAAFFLSFAMGGALYGIALLGAPLAAGFFGNSALTPLLRVLSLRLIVASLDTVPTALLSKDLKFKALAWPNLISATSFAVVAIPLAALGLGVWSLVWGNLVRVAIDTIAVWLLVSWRPTMRFNSRAALELLNYSKHVVSIAFGVFLQRNLDTVTVGKLLGMSAVGAYNLAFNLANALPQLLNNALSPVLLPTCSQIQNERERLANVHLRLDKYLLLVIVPAELLVVVLARDGILTFYGPQWETAILPLQILCLYALIRQIATTNGPILLVRNKAKALNYSIYASLALLVLLAYPAAHFKGLLGISILMNLVVMSSATFTFYHTFGALGTRPTRYLALATAPFCAAAASVLLYGVSLKLLPLQITDYHLSQVLLNASILAVRGTILLLSYCGVAYLIDGGLRNDVRATISGIRRLRQPSTAETP